jgi:hypothetical protein
MGGIADGAHINDNSSFHTLLRDQLPPPQRRVGRDVPEFLDKFRETGHEISPVLMQFFAVLFVLVGGIDDGDFGEVVHVGAVGLIGLAGANCSVEVGQGGGCSQEDASVLGMSVERPDALQARPSRPEHCPATELTRTPIDSSVTSRNTR